VGAGTVGEDVTDANQPLPMGTLEPVLLSAPLELDSSQAAEEAEMSTQETGEADEVNNNSLSPEVDSTGEYPESSGDLAASAAHQNSLVEDDSASSDEEDIDDFLNRCIEEDRLAEAHNEAVRTREVTIFMRGERIKASRWRDRVFEACANILKHLPGLRLDVLAEINEETAFTSAEFVRLNNADTRELRFWFQRTRPGKNRESKNATLAALFELSAKVEIYDQLYTVLRSHGPLGERKVLDGNGLLLESLAQAVRSVITRHENYKLWMERPTVVMHTLMHVVNQMHHDAVLTSTLQSTEDARTCFRRQGLHRFM
jgi:hypothetical protein